MRTNEDNLLQLQSLLVDQFQRHLIRGHLFIGAILIGLLASGPLTLRWPPNTHFDVITLTLAVTLFVMLCPLPYLGLPDEPGTRVSPSWKAALVRIAKLIPIPFAAFFIDPLIGLLGIMALLTIAIYSSGLQDHGNMLLLLKAGQSPMLPVYTLTHILLTVTLFITYTLLVGFLFAYSLDPYLDLDRQTTL